MLPAGNGKGPVWLHSSTPFLQWGRRGTNRATIPLPEHCLLQGLAGKLTVVWLLSSSWTFVIFDINSTNNHTITTTAINPDFIPKHDIKVYKFPITERRPSTSHCAWLYTSFYCSNHCARLHFYACHTRVAMCKHGSRTGQFSSTLDARPAHSVRWLTTCRDAENREDV